jgi:hypothetical protein
MAVAGKLVHNETEDLTTVRALVGESYVLVPVIEVDKAAKSIGRAVAIMVFFRDGASVQSHAHLGHLPKMSIFFPDFRISRSPEVPPAAGGTGGIGGTGGGTGRSWTAQLHFARQDFNPSRDG